MRLFSINVFAGLLWAVSVSASSPIGLHLSANKSITSMAGIFRALRDVGLSLNNDDLVLIEDRQLEHFHFKTFAQLKNGKVLRDRLLRVWSATDDGSLVQLEADLEPPSTPSPEPKEEDCTALTSPAPLAPPLVLSPEISFPVRIFPTFEEIDATHEILPRKADRIYRISPRLPATDADPYAGFSQSYDENKLDPVLGLTALGRRDGFWNLSHLKQDFENGFRKLPQTDNQFRNQGVVLSGKYAIVSIHPDFVRQAKSLGFTPGYSTSFLGNYANDKMVPAGARFGRPLKSENDAWNRVARRLPDNDPETYLKDGFDEIQVYWAMDKMMTSLRALGFTDPELSEKPFNAVLYNPAIERRDNTYYTNNTINFTIYPPTSHNMARNNPEIWHEMGHGIMHRLLGDIGDYEDGGCTTEGVADFIASLVVNDVIGTKPFKGREGMRITNPTAFYLTNEAHDDGEACGGAMNDLLNAAIARNGDRAIGQIADLTFDALRLMRNNSHIVMESWFDSLLYADQLGNRPIREPAEFHHLILNSLWARNWQIGNADPAEFKIYQNKARVTAYNKGSRRDPIEVKLKPEETADFPLTVRVKNGVSYSFRFPVKVRVELRNGPVQGSNHWEGEENGPLEYVLKSDGDEVTVPLKVSGKCDALNTDDGCKDYADIQIFNRDGTKPVGKKRFYVRVITP